MKRILLVLAACMLIAPALFSQFEPGGPPDPLRRPDMKLPNGKSQRDEIVKADFKKNLEDVDKLARLSQEVKEELNASDSHIVSVKTLKKLEDVEKLARSIQGRMKRY